MFLSLISSFLPSSLLLSPSVHSHVQPTFTQDSELQWSTQMRSGYAVRRHSDSDADF